MSGPGRWAPLLLCLLQAAPGRPFVAPPRNVTLFSQNFNVYLAWLPGLGNPKNVTYFVAYQSILTLRRWRRVHKCWGTSALLCSLMCLEKQDLYNKFKARVRAASASASSPWVESQYLEYLLEVELGPPTLVLTWKKNILTVNATYQLPPCIPILDLQYEVQFWKEGARNKTLLPAATVGQPVQIPLQPSARGRHCLSARTTYTFIDPKYSSFSEPSCLSLEAPGSSWTVLTLPLLSPLVVVAAVGSVMWKNLKGDPWFQREKTPPRALDFSGHRRPVAAFEPRAPESLDELFLCPQKKLTRKVSLAPPVRASASLLSGSEDSAEDEEEDMDDRVSVRSYMEQPLFQEQELQRPESSEADESGVHSGGPWTPVGHSEGCDSGESSDRSWPSTRDSLLWDEAGSSSYTGTRKGLGQGPGGEEHQEELLPCPESPEDLGILEEPLKDGVSSWASWGSLSPRRNLLPGEPLISLQTLTFGWDHRPEEEEEEEGGEEERESEPEDSSSYSGQAGDLLRTKIRSGTLGHYMAR
ncbi:interferon lambda receptor 1 [Octodon degus]|uniref:Interferon lambda receptor 1 n=1 Tax=Octodon degus TaxID=10160 RepID=A0A6P3FHQ1_OCTDE|nr:interferon lambda receptor 1 [Octodon degus]